MTTSNENHDPRSLPNRSILPTHSEHKWNGKRNARKGPANRGLTVSLLHNITPELCTILDCDNGTQLHTPPSSQCMVGSRDKLVEKTRLPISPPPEEEIRIKELSTLGHVTKELLSRLPVRSSGAFIVPGPALSPAQFQLQANQPANRASDQGIDPPGTSANPIPNPRKRARSVTCTRQGSLTKRRPRAGRSATPEVPYEPPTEQFTPPRDVVLRIPSPAVSSRSRKRKASTPARAKLSVDTKVVRIKAERLASPFPLPPLDLYKPVPPPSPTDDPLLLVGPPVVARRSVTPSAIPNKLLVDASVGVEDVQDGPSASICVSPTTIRHMDQSLCKFGPTVMDKTSLIGLAFDGPSAFNATFDSDDSDTCDDVGDDRNHCHPQVMPDPFVFDPDQSTGSHIFHSDDEAAESGEDEGEFTGRFRYYSVPVEQDPPSSATRARRESWGRPISPFPFAKRSSAPPSLKARAHVPPPRSVSPARSISPQRLVTCLPHFNAHEATDHDEAFHDRPTRKLQECRGASNDDDAFFDEDRLAPGIVEVSSDDPKAAARAAAILKLVSKNVASPSLVGSCSLTPQLQHHSYIVDGLVAQRARRRSHSIRRSFVDMDSDHDDDSVRRARRKSIAASAGVMQHRPQPTVPSPLVRLTINATRSPFSPLAFGQDALKEAERQIRSASASPGGPTTPCRSVSPLTESFGHCVITSLSLYKNVEPSTEAAPIQAENIKTWTKAHWRTLDTCFTDERLSVGRTMGLENHLAEVDDIEIESVVERFLAQIGDNGEGWDRDMLLRRATALSTRQRAGNGAPPSSRGLTPQNHSPALVIPVYSPLAASPTSSPETEVGVSTNLLPSLLAPRYAHLHVPTKPIQFPKAKSAKDIVNLNHVEPPRSQRRRTVSGPIFIPGRNRKDGGGSVKDLVKSFEAVQRITDEEITRSRNRLEARKTASVGNLHKSSIWKP